MRIAYVVSRYPAVSHTFIVREVRALRQSGIDVHAFTIRRPADEELPTESDREESRRTFAILPPCPLRLIRDHGLAFVRHPGRYLLTLWGVLLERPPGIRAAIWAVFYFAEAGILAEELRRREIHHVHAHFANVASEVAALAARLSNIRWSVTLHGLSDFGNPAMSRLPQKIKGAAFVICVSEFGRAQAMLQCPPDHWPKLHIVRCGVDTQRFSPHGRNDPLGRDGPVRLLVIARLGPEKGHAVLIDAFRELLESDVDFVCTFVGDGPERARLETLVRAAGLNGRVTFTGAMGQDRIASFYDEADIFLLPSLSEGLPVVLMEAMAKEVPVIASRIMGIPELVEDGVSGLLVSPGQPRPLAQAISRLEADAELRKQMGKRGREKVCAEFDIRLGPRKLARHFESALASNAPGRMK